MTDDAPQGDPPAFRSNDGLGPLPEPPTFYRYQFQAHYGPVWRSSAENWNGCPPLASEGLYSAEQMRAYAAQAELERLRAENAALKLDLQYARDGLTKGRSRMREDNERLAREAHTWSKAAETYAAELERHKPLMQAVEWILEDGHMNQEHLARLRAAWEGA